MSRIYLASPYGFSESTLRFLDELKSRLRSDGHEVIDPWELGQEILTKFPAPADGSSNERSVAELTRLNHSMAEQNRKAIDRSEVIVAALDGPDVDSGTASEVGYAFAKGKMIFGYRGDFRLTGENNAAVVNMQVQYWIEESRGQIVRTLSDLMRALRENTR